MSATPRPRACFKWLAPDVTRDPESLAPDTIERRFKWLAPDVTRDLTSTININIGGPTVNTFQVARAGCHA